MFDALESRIVKSSPRRVSIGGSFAACMKCSRDNILSSTIPAKHKYYCLNDFVTVTNPRFMIHIIPKCMNMRSFISASWKIDTIKIQNEVEDAKNTT